MAYIQVECNQDFKNRLDRLLAEKASVDHAKCKTRRAAVIEALTLYMAEIEQYIAYRREEASLKE